MHSLKRDELTNSYWSYNAFICCTLKDNDDVILTIKSPYDLINHYKHDINKSNYFPPFIFLNLAIIFYTKKINLCSYFCSCYLL